jgi:prepilin-type processing-associated H-X9-DG protein
MPVTGKRLAYTLIEVLVVIGVTVVVAGLLVAAVQRSRETAMRTQCANNLKQIGLACQNFHSIHSHLPPGTVMSPASSCPNPGAVSAPPYSGPYTGTLPFLLPYLDQEGLYARIPPGYFLTSVQNPTSAGAWAYSSPPFDTANGSFAGIPSWALTRVKAFECPASPLSAPLGDGADPHGAFVVQGIIDGRWLAPASVVNSLTLDWRDFLPPSSVGFSPDVQDVGCTNYVSSCGAFGLCQQGETFASLLTAQGYSVSSPVPATIDLRKYSGPFDVNSLTRLTDVSDGTSNTIAFGETLGGRVGSNGNVSSRYAWMGAGMMVGVYGCSAVPTANRFSSFHTAVCNFLFCDGSVRPVAKNNNLDYLNLQPMPQYFAFLSALGMSDGNDLDSAMLE